MIKKFGAVLLVGFFFIGAGCGKNSPAAQERTLQTLDKPEYTMSYPEGYTENTVLSEDTVPVYESKTLYTTIRVTPELDFPADTKLDATGCKALESGLKVLESDVVSLNESFTKGNIQGCKIKTQNVEGSNDFFDYFAYYKPGTTVVYVVQTRYSTTTDPVEINNLTRAAEAFLVK